MATDGFGRLSEMSRQIIALARKEAAFFQHDRIRPEHILLAIAAVPEAVATRLLRRQGIDPQRVVKEVVGHLSVGRSPDSRGIGLDQAAWDCLRRASAEAETLGSEYIGTEHLLLGILGDPSLVAARVLASLGVDADQLRHHASGRDEPRDPGRAATASPPRPPAGRLPPSPSSSATPAAAAARSGSRAWRKPAFRCRWRIAAILPPMQRASESPPVSKAATWARSTAT